LSLPLACRAIVTELYSGGIDYASVYTVLLVDRYAERARFNVLAGPQQLSARLKLLELAP